MKVEIKITRQVIFEKFNIKHEMRDFLLSQIDGCEIKLLERYPSSTFFVKNDKFIFEQDRKNGRLWVRYEEMWSVFESKYQLLHEQIQAFMIDTLENQLKTEGLTPSDSKKFVSLWLENQLKTEGLTPFDQLCSYVGLLENQLKTEGLTPAYGFKCSPDLLENQLKTEG